MLSCRPRRNTYRSRSVDKPRKACMRRVHLLLERCDVRRKEPVQFESVSFLLGESSSFIEQRIVQKLVAEQARFNEPTLGQGLRPTQHCRSPRDSSTRDNHLLVETAEERFLANAEVAAGKPFGDFVLPYRAQRVPV